MKHLLRQLLGLGSAKVGRDNEARRHEWVIGKLKNMQDGLRILDAGAGECRYKEFCTHLEYVSQDFNQYDGTGDQKGLQTTDWDISRIDIVSDICNIPYENESFDIILCTEVIEHIPDPVAALKEFNRLLKHDGQLILTAPFCSLTHFSPYHFATGFNRYFYQYWMKELGLEIIELSANGNYFEYLAQELRRLPQVESKYAQNRPGRKDRLLVSSILNRLERMSNFDNGSSEVLCYGYHLHARKCK